MTTKLMIIDYKSFSDKTLEQFSDALKEFGVICENHCRGDDQYYVTISNEPVDDEQVWAYLSARSEMAETGIE